MPRNRRHLGLLGLVILVAGCGSASPRTPDPTTRPASEDRAGAIAPARTLASAEIPSGPEFGAGITRGSLDPFPTVMTSPASFSSRPVLVRAEVIDVCKAKGCWMKITDGTHEARVRFQDYAFFVPKDCEGKVAWIEGSVEERTVSVEELRHYAEESGTEDPASITEPRTLVGFLATGVRLTEP